MIIQTDMAIDSSQEYSCLLLLYHPSTLWVAGIITNQNHSNSSVFIAWFETRLSILILHIRIHIWISVSTPILMDYLATAGECVSALSVFTIFLYTYTYDSSRLVYLNRSVSVHSLTHSLSHSFIECGKVFMSSHLSVTLNSWVETLIDIPLD